MGAADHFLIIGANHRSSSLALRDALFIDEAATPAFLDHVRAAGLPQALVLSTCDRVEVAAIAPDAETTRAVVTSVLAQRAGVDPISLGQQLYVLRGAEALKHIFAVVSALDSLVVGEPHVTAQVREAQRLAQASGMSGAELETILRGAYSAAKRVRNETAVADGAVSVAAAAIHFARSLHGDLSRCSALLVGSGEMGELVAEALKDAGVSKLVVAAPRAYRAESAAKLLDAHVVAFERLPEALITADVVVTSVGGREHVVRSAEVKAALKARKQRPIFFIDTGIPGDVEPGVGKVDNAFLYDLNDLEKEAMKGRTSREAEARHAWTIIEEDVAAFLKGDAERVAVPAITALHQRFESERLKALEEGGPDAEKVSRLLVSRLLHHPSQALRGIASQGEKGDGDWAASERLIRHLFKLEGDGA